MDEILKSNPNAIDRLLDAGAIDKLLDILAQGDLGDEVAAAVVHTLTNMAKMSEKAAAEEAKRRIDSEKQRERLGKGYYSL